MEVIANAEVPNDAFRQFIVDPHLPQYQIEVAYQCPTCKTWRKNEEQDACHICQHSWQTRELWTEEEVLSFDCASVIVKQKPQKGA